MACRGGSGSSPLGYTTILTIPVRDLAALMGHKPGTHQKHYEKWIRDHRLLEFISVAVNGKD